MAVARDRVATEFIVAVKSQLRHVPEEDIVVRAPQDVTVVVSEDDESSSEDEMVVEHDVALGAIVAGGDEDERDRVATKFVVKKKKQLRHVEPPKERDIRQIVSALQDAKKTSNPTDAKGVGAPSGIGKAGDNGDSDDSDDSSSYESEEEDVDWNKLLAMSQPRAHKDSVAVTRQRFQQRKMRVSGAVEEEEDEEEDEDEDEEEEEEKESASEEEQSGTMTPSHSSFSQSNITTPDVSVSHSETTAAVGGSGGQGKPRSKRKPRRKKGQSSKESTPSKENSAGGKPRSSGGKSGSTKKVKGRKPTKKKRKGKKRRKKKVPRLNSNGLGAMGPNLRIVKRSSATSDQFEDVTHLYVPPAGDNNDDDEHSDDNDDNLNAQTPESSQQAAPSATAGMSDTPPPDASPARMHRGGVAAAALPGVGDLAAFRAALPEELTRGLSMASERDSQEARAAVAAKYNAEMAALGAHKQSEDRPRSTRLNTADRHAVAGFAAAIAGDGAPKPAATQVKERPESTRLNTADRHAVAGFAAAIAGNATDSADAPSNARRVTDKGRATRQAKRRPLATSSSSSSSGLCGCWAGLFGRWGDRKARSHSQLGDLYDTTEHSPPTSLKHIPHTAPTAATPPTVPAGNGAVQEDDESAPPRVPTWRGVDSDSDSWDADNANGGKRDNEVDASSASASAASSDSPRTEQLAVEELLSMPPRAHLDSVVVARQLRARRERWKAEKAAQNAVEAAARARKLRKAKRSGGKRRKKPSAGVPAAVVAQTDCVARQSAKPSSGVVHKGGGDAKGVSRRRKPRRAKKAHQRDTSEDSIASGTSDGSKGWRSRGVAAPRPKDHRRRKKGANTLSSRLLGIPHTSSVASGSTGGMDLPALSVLDEDEPPHSVAGADSVVSGSVAGSIAGRPRKKSYIKPWRTNMKPKSKKAGSRPQTAGRR